MPPSKLNTLINLLTLEGAGDHASHAQQIINLLDQGCTPNLKSIQLLFTMSGEQLSDEQQDALENSIHLVFHKILETGYDPLNGKPSIFDDESLEKHWHSALCVLSALGKLEAKRQFVFRTPQGGSSLHYLLNKQQGVDTLSCMVLQGLFSPTWITHQDNEGNTAFHSMWQAALEGAISLNVDFTLVSRALERVGFDVFADNAKGVSVADMMLSHPRIASHWETMDEYEDLPSGTSENQMKTQLAAHRITVNTSPARPTIPKARL